MNLHFPAGLRLTISCTANTLQSVCYRRLNVYKLIVTAWLVHVPVVIMFIVLCMYYYYVICHYCYRGCLIFCTVGRRVAKLGLRLKNTVSRVVYLIWGEIFLIVNF